MIDTFGFLLETRLLYGIGWTRGIGDFLRDKGFSRVLVLVDQGCAEHSPYFSEIKGILAASARELFVEVLRGSEEPDYDYLDQVAAKARSLPLPDLLVGIGGGSAMDIAKATAVLVTNPGQGIEYRGFDKVQTPGVPCLLIPTTAGTGSEVTINAVFTDKKEMKKLGINGRHMSASFAVLDAEWTMSCPRPVAVSSGMDALTHALESFMCKKSNALTRMFSREAVRLLFANLPALVNDPKDRQARQNILLAAYVAGAALFNSGSGIAGALSYPIGVHFKVPHGIGGGIFLASVIEYNVAHGYEDYAELLDLIEQRPEWSRKQKSARFAELLRALSDKLGVPKHLDQWGVTRANIEGVAKLMLPLQAAFDQNPVPFSADKDAPEMLKRHVGP